MEYTKFGKSGDADEYMEREDSSVEWRDADPGIARMAILEEKEQRLAAREAYLNDHTIDPSDPRWGSPPRKLMAKITRAPVNEARAAKVGLTADELADRLARPDENNGTNIRLPDAEFDDLMAELDLSPEEARARFSGTFFTP